MHGKLIVFLTLIGGATSCVLVADIKLCFLKRGWGPNWQPVIGKLLTLTNSNIRHCFINAFSDQKMCKSTHYH